MGWEARARSATARQAAWAFSALGFVAGGVDDSLDFSAYDGLGITYTVSQVGLDTVFAFSNGDQVTLSNVNLGAMVQNDPFGWS